MNTIIIISVVIILIIGLYSLFKISVSAQAFHQIANQFEIEVSNAKTKEDLHEIYGRLAKFHNEEAWHRVLAERTKKIRATIEAKLEILN